jgi:hypothetical protein
MNIFLSLIENFLFSISLFLLIPPVPSNDLVRYDFIPMGWVSVFLFSLSKLLSVKLGKESIWKAIFQTLIFFIYSFFCYERYKYFNTP